MAAGIALIGLGGLVAPAFAAPGDPPTSRALDAGTRSVTLVTGDRVDVPSGGTGSQLALRPVTSQGGQSFQDSSGDSYLVPALAAPYLGKQLDPALFDVSALLRDGLGDGPAGGRVPVRLDYAAGSTPVVPAGVTLTSTDGTSASGYLTAASAPDFGAALKRTIAADVTAGRRPGSTPLAAGLTRIGLAAAGAPTVAQPRYPLHTLQLNGLDAHGVAGDLYAILLNTDSLRRQAGFVELAGGVARVQVPAGHYSANLSLVDFDDQGNLTALRSVTQDDITVPDTAGTTAVTLDGRQASSAVTVTGTPRPAVQDTLVVNDYRFDATGAGVHIANISGTAPVYVNPQPAPAAGRRHFVVHWGGASADPTAGYRYDVAFASDDGVAADQTYRVRADQLATVHHHLYRDPGRHGTVGWLTGPTDPEVEPTWGYSYRIATPNRPTAPGDLTQYLGTADGGQWSNGYDDYAVELQGDVRTFRAGQEYGLDWARGPLAAGLGRYTGSGRCLACVAGGTVTLGLPATHDSVADHTSGAGTFQTTHVTLYRDGERLVDSDGTVGVVVQGLPATAGTLREVLDTTQLPGEDYTQSLTTHTDVTVHYDPATDPALPTTDSCQDGTAGTPCRVLAVPTLTYRLTADRTNTSTLATQLMTLDAGHVSYDGAGSSGRITGATVQVSFDNGTTWTNARVAGAAGHYTASWCNPSSAKGTSPSLRVTATDAAGNTIAQTITAAYTIAGSAS